MLRTLGDRFELERLAAEGGMGAVYRALDRKTGGFVALKVMRDAQSSAAERFVQEAQLLSGLRHEAIVGYVAHGETPEGEPWLAMDWLEGHDLHARLRHGPLGIGESVALVRRVADALAVAHARGIVHRDIKPSNLFLVDGALERVTVLDFGIAQLGAGRVMTYSGAIIGTPGYMAPEQARGETSIDSSVDVFALGCVLFECLTGRPAFAGEHVMAVLAKILFEDAPRARALRDAIPAEVDALVSRMLAKTARGRPGSGSALRAELDELSVMTEVLAHTTVGGPPTISTGELRVVSVVIARSRSSETVADEPTLHPGQVTPARDRVRSALAPFGARVEQLADGSFVAVVSGHGSATDQAAAAARCALAMQRVLPDVPLALATGRALMSGRVPLGEVIDRAVQLLRIGAAEEVRLDDVSGALLGQRFEIGGDAEGLLLRGERVDANVARTLLGRPTPFVGRDRELSSLQAMLREVIDESVSRVALVVGPAGSGKSRLRQEFLARSEVEHWMARGDPIGAGSPFGMLAQLVRRAVGIVDGEPLAVRQRKLTVHVERHVEPAHGVRVREFLGELSGAPFEDEGSEQLSAARRDAVLMGDQIRRAFEDFVCGVCRAQPVLIVLEDLHWGDLPTIKAIEGALRFLKQAPLMVVAFARPEIHETFARLWNERGLHELRLGELSPRACERFARTMLGSEVSPEVVTRVVERCDGNAFYLEELIRAVSEGRVEALPDTVLAMVQSRLAALRPDARQVLRAASVFGGTFWRGGVESLLGGEHKAPELRALLAELCDREVLHAVSNGRFPGQHQYAFRHALLRDAAYAMLTYDDRKLAHVLAGTWLEEAGEQDAVVLAEHFERGGKTTAAAQWWCVATEAAVEGYDFEGAVGRAERAVSCGIDRVGLGELSSILALANVLQGRLAEAKECGLDAMEQLDPTSDHWWLAARRLANAHIRLGEGDALSPLAERLAQAAPAIATSVSVTSLEVLAECLCFAGRYDVADSLFRLSRELQPEHLRAADEGHMLVARAARAAVDGDPAAALSLRRAATAAFERAGRLRSSCHEAANVGAVLNELGAFADAERTLSTALEGAERMELRSARLLALNNLGWSYAGLGRLDEALQTERAAVTASIEQKDRRFESGSRTLLARIHALRNDLDAALEEATLGLRLTDTSPTQRPGARAALAAILLSRGEVARALAESQEAMAELAELGAVEEGESLVRLVHAEALDAAGEALEARTAIQSAHARLLERAEAIRDPDWRASFLRQVPENARTVALAARD